MPATALLAGLLAKVGGLGTAAKAALAGATAVTTLGVAGGAAGVLPGPAQDAVAAAVGTVTPFELPVATGAVGSARAGAPGADDLRVPAPVSLPPVVATATPTPSASASVSPSAAGPAKAVRSTDTHGAAEATAPTVPQVTVPPAVAGLVSGLPACVKDLVPATGPVPDPATLAARIQACIPQVLSTANLPPEVARCVSAVLGAIGGASGMDPARIASLGSLNLSACVPMDASTCVNSMMRFLATLPGPGSRLPTTGSFAGVGTVSGCAPMDVRACLTSITSAVRAGTTPSLDLSACMPTSAPVPTVPGTSGLPGLAGALAFFGR